MTNQQLNELSHRLYIKILAEIEANPNLDVGLIVNNFLQPFNEEVKNSVMSEIHKASQSLIDMGFVGIVWEPVKEVELSSRLYKNSLFVANEVQKVVNSYTSAKETVSALSKALYDGYDTYDDILDIKKDAPTHLRKHITRENIDKLKTKSLKAGYLKMLDATNEAELKRATRIAVEEKCRYYAHRIAMTEEAKAYNLMKAGLLIKKDVKKVKVRMSDKHKIVCICDKYANKVYDIAKAPMPPFHPFCQCWLEETNEKVDNVKMEDGLKLLSDIFGI